jgi:hypothetical protein
VRRSRAPAGQARAGRRASCRQCGRRPRSVRSQDDVGVPARRSPRARRTRSNGWLGRRCGSSRRSRGLLCRRRSRGRNSGLRDCRRHGFVDDRRWSGNRRGRIGCRRHAGGLGAREVGCRGRGSKCLPDGGLGGCAGPRRDGVDLRESGVDRSRYVSDAGRRARGSSDPGCPQRDADGSCQRPSAK